MLQVEPVRTKGLQIALALLLVPLIDWCMKRYKEWTNITIDIEGRELSVMDLHYLNNRVVVSGVMHFDCPPLVAQSLEKLQAAAHQVRTVTPMLQARVVERRNPDGTTKLVYSTIKTKDKYSGVATVYKTDLSDEQTVKAAWDFVEKECSYFKTDPDAIRNKSIIGHIVVGQNRAAFAFISPHHFFDAVSVGSVSIMFFMYARLPRFLWLAVDLLSRREVPTMKQMIMKKDIYKIKDTAYKPNPSSSRYDPQNFSFSNYDMMAPDALSILRGGEYDIAAVSPEHINKCRNLLREAGISMSTAFAALSIKTLAMILENHERNPDSKPLLAASPVDGRNLGKWGDKRDRAIHLPIVGNFVFGISTQVPYEEALRGSIAAISKRIKTDIHRLQTDIAYRAEEMSAVGVPQCGIMCGTSSILVPQVVFGALTGIQNLRIDGSIDFGPFPHCWIYIVTVGKLVSEITADIKLPIPGLDEKEVLDAVFRAAAGSPLEVIFSKS
jgi:hypothetical protein